MCGIVYIEAKQGKGVAKKVWKRYLAQKSRGSDGYGFCAIKEEVLDKVVRTKTEQEVRKALFESNLSKIMFHHRLPTSTPNLAECNHPIELVGHKALEHDYYFIHNGVISGSYERKTEHEKLGFKYSTVVNKKTSYSFPNTGKEYEGYEITQFNDSESLFIDLVMFVEGLSASVPSKGSVAFLLLQVARDGTALKLFYGRNEGNPLMEVNNDNYFTLCSQGEGVLVQAHKLHSYDYITGERASSYLHLPLSGYDYGGYSGNQYGFHDRKDAQKAQKQRDFYTTHTWDSLQQRYVPKNKQLSLPTGKSVTIKTDEKLAICDALINEANVYQKKLEDIELQIDIIEQDIDMLKESGFPITDDETKLMALYEEQEDIEALIASINEELEQYGYFPSPTDDLPVINYSEQLTQDEKW